MMESGTSTGPWASDARQPLTQAHFILGRDYHLGDLLWLTPVLQQYREFRKPSMLRVSLPNRPINRILENNPLIDELLYEEPSSRWCRGEGVHDLRLISLTLTMVRQWRRYLPWLYYRDLWLQPRGQWLATYLGLGSLKYHRPILRLTQEDMDASTRLPNPYVVLAPGVGSYSLPLLARVWQGVKGWDRGHWAQLAGLLGEQGIEPVTVGAAGQEVIPGTRPLLGLSIRQAAGVIGAARGLISVESGLWFIAAALRTPFVVVPWWLSKRVDWPAPMKVPYRLVERREASVSHVLARLKELLRDE